VHVHAKPTETDAGRLKFDDEFSDVGTDEEHVDGSGALSKPLTIVWRSLILPIIFHMPSCLPASINFEL
jgi:hypothetical protein